MPSGFLTIPIFLGGQRRAALSQSDIELSQLQALRLSTAQKVEERLRSLLVSAQADFDRIDLTGIASEASRRNYELVADAYARGAASIVDLLDAQDASLSADAASIDSLYRFLTTIMSVQRASGGYDFMLAEAERNALAEALRQSLNGEER